MSQVHWLGQVEWLGDAAACAKGCQDQFGSVSDYNKTALDACLAACAAGTAVTQPAGGGTPGAVVPGAVVDCAVLCQGKSGVALALCLVSCEQGKTPAPGEPPPPLATQPKQETTPATTTPPAEKKTPWGLIVGGVVVLGGLAWLAMRSGGVLAGVAENPNTSTRTERRNFLYDMAKIDRRDGTDWAERLLEEWSRRQIVGEGEYADLRRMLRGRP